MIIILEVLHGSSDILSLGDVSPEKWWQVLTILLDINFKGHIFTTVALH